MSDAKPDHTSIPIFGGGDGGGAREVQGVLPNEGALQEATNALLLAGFDRGDLSVPAQPGAASPAGSMGATGNPGDARDAQQARTMGASTIGVTGALIGGAIVSVATGGAMLPVAAAAIAAGAGAGGLTHAGLQGAANTREAVHNERGAAGTLRLAALVRDAGKEKSATEILRQAGAMQVETVERR